MEKILQNYFFEIKENLSILKAIKNFNNIHILKNYIFKLNLSGILFLGRTQY